MDAVLGVPMSLSPGGDGSSRALCLSHPSAPIPHPGEEPGESQGNSDTESTGTSELMTFSWNSPGREKGSRAVLLP